MSRRMLFISLMLVLVLPCLSFAPAAMDDRPDLKELAQARYQSARELFDESWVMYKRKIQPEGVVYMCSHRLMLSQLDCAETIAERVSACQGHLDRMKRMECMVIKLRDLGFSKKFELKEVDYFARSQVLACERSRRGGAARCRNDGWGERNSGALGRLRSRFGVTSGRSRIPTDGYRRNATNTSSMTCV